MSFTLPPSLADRVLELACEIQQIPAPTFGEAARAEFVRQKFGALGMEDVQTDSVGNVYARLPARVGGGARPSLVTAHTDTVFPTDTPLELRRTEGRVYGPGIGDNSLGVAGLLGLAWALRERDIPLPGDLWLAANVAEEGLGDLRGMRAVVDRLGDRVGATIVVEGMALGRVYHGGISVRRYRIGVQTEAGHSWHRFGQPTAIHVLVRLGARLTDLIVPHRPKTTFNIGVIQGGTSVNTLAGEANLQLDLRSEDPAVLGPLAARVEEIAAEFSAPNVRVTCEVIGNRPAGLLPREHPLVQLAARSLAAVGIPEVSFEFSSTDANVPLSRGLPCVCIGLTHGGDAHTPHEYIETAPLSQGLHQLVLTTMGAFQIGIGDR